MPTINREDIHRQRPERQPKKPSEGRKERHEIYDTREWRKLRDAKLMLNPLCERCESMGILTPATEVHHIRSFMDTGNRLVRQRLAFDFDNLMSVCSDCHHALHREENARGYGV